MKFQMDTPNRDNNPVIIDLGKQKRSRVKKLRDGRGPLLDDIRQAIEELRQAGTISGAATPVVLLVERKPRETLF